MSPGPFTQWLGHELGVWPPSAAATIAGSPARARPGWDGRVRPVAGVACPAGVVVSVPEAAVPAVTALEAGVFSPAWVAGLADAVGLAGAWAWSDRTVVRWQEPGAVLPDAEPLGEWVSAQDPRLPGWLRPFNGGVLAAWDDTTGAYVAGVGVKAHDPLGREIAVGTEPAARGRGLARRLVGTATRHLLAEGAAVMYLHHKDNEASARVAEAAGFPDLGWRMVGLAALGTDDDPW